MKELNILLQLQFDKMCQIGKLFKSQMSGKDVWDFLLLSFEKDPVFRDPESSEHNCNLCNNFIRRYGNIITVIDGKLQTIFDVETTGEYENTVKSLSTELKKHKIQDVFYETYDSLQKLPYESCSKTNLVFKLGIPKNLKRYTKEEAEKFGIVKENEIREFNHFSFFCRNNL